ncbi:hypothetical protein HG530_006162 [Fusarium avenaceum]|nr:hypothetical protein HG530_006162 [Fusarium avenaceum]
MSPIMPRRERAALLLDDFILELALDISSGPVLADKIPSLLTAQFPPTANSSGVLPDKLGEVASLFGKLSVVKVILVALVTPRFDAGGDVWITYRQVLAIGTTGVLEFAVVEVVEVVCCKLLKGLVPLQRGSVVFLAVEIGAVQDSRREGLALLPLGLVGGNGHRSCDCDICSEAGAYEERGEGE